MSLLEEQSKRPGSHVNSSVSVESHQSKGEVPNFSEETPSATKSESPGSHAYSSVSVKSYHSKGEVPNFSEETPSATKSKTTDTLQQKLLHYKLQVTNSKTTSVKVLEYLILTPLLCEDTWKLEICKNVLQRIFQTVRNKIFWSDESQIHAS
ncbi:hypothetical protein IRJ41_012361 [Triplophysa rosa]|uniref:Uncharacterized protein n=1 Tax=Triplophysa rosa TaxID=992332 RepID=A0A9W7T450_TRIRA|nr:hypothetical protein IRJ41_012361 [Triplophysa rosa]